ncbi:LysR family transcriptional regulator [Fictibacillus sp. Mic-4]|uniref:LysR family transcriptional regulator n=1 Tax=Fictibacillus sp. Mic-4 TaxID=3132826 RepID=UPI003CFAEBC9
MEYKQLITFRTAAEKLNFTRTAEALNFAQSSVTAQIQSLETELGVQLFERLGKRLILTEAGRQLKIYANKIISLTEEAKTAVAGEKEPTGKLVIGAPESQCTYRLPSVLAKFRERYPKVQLSFHPGTSDQEVMFQLAEGVLDVAVLMDIPGASEHVIVEPLVKESIKIVTHPEHSLTDKESVMPFDLQGEPLLLTGCGCSYRRIFEDSLSSVGVQPSNIIEFASIEAIKQCVIAGLGIAVLPAIAIQKDIEQGRMKELAWGGCGFSIYTYLAWHKDKWISPALKAFIDVTREVLKG